MTMNIISCKCHGYIMDSEKDHDIFSHDIGN